MVVKDEKGWSQEGSKLARNCHNVHTPKWVAREERQPNDG